uniref:Uncharacterized protein n=1 Tax=Romanomermis culicivorax TaxID=13658 RepID=A0A915J261_ROMCU
MQKKRQDKEKRIAHEENKAELDKKSKDFFMSTSICRRTARDIPMPLDLKIFFEILEKGGPRNVGLGHFGVAVLAPISSALGHFGTSQFGVCSFGTGHFDAS